MKKYLLNEKPIVDLLTNNKIVVVDGGARGELFPPFKYINEDIIKVLRFEPDSDADISTFSKNDLVFNTALWDKKEQIKINIAIEPSSSSVYPFNRELQKHIDPFIDKRKTKETVLVDAISLDQLVAENDSLKIDFIKLDIHAAEYEVLKGAKEVLKSTLGLLVESWLIPIHKGQKVRAHVESLVYESGFYVFEEYERALWARHKNKFTKRQPVALDTFFLKDPILDKNITDKVDAVKIIGFANLFDHNAYALQLTDHFYENKFLDKELYTFIKTEINKTIPSSFQRKIQLKLQKLRHRISSCAFK